MSDLYSISAEQAVLGALMLSQSAWDALDGRLGEDDFYRHDHRLIFSAMESLAHRRAPLDVLTVSEELDRLGTLDVCGGMPYVVTIARETPSATNIAAYAEIVRCKALQRRTLAALDEAAGLVRGGGDIAEISQEVERLIFAALHQGHAKAGWSHVKPVLASVVDAIEIGFHAESHITGLPSGFLDLDDMTTGFQPADLIIVAGRPSMGKTAFGMQIADAVAARRKYGNVAVFSLEMPKEQLAKRWVASNGRIDFGRIRTGKLEDDEWPRLTSAINILAESGLYIDDAPGLTVSGMRSSLRRLISEHGPLAFVIVDYLQLMADPKAKGRFDEISSISRGLKALAKEFGVPVMALSQLSRDLEKRPNKRPIMSDLRESGQIEQDADLIIFLYRDEVYNKDLDNPEKGIAEAIIAKQRNGPIGTVRLTFQGEFTRFGNFTDREYG